MPLEGSENTTRNVTLPTIRQKMEHAQAIGHTVESVVTGSCNPLTTVTDMGTIIWMIFAIVAIVNASAMTSVATHLVL